MQARVDTRSLERDALLWSALCEFQADLQAVWARTAAAHSAACNVLATHRVQLERSRALVERSRALCHPLRAVPPPQEAAPAANAAPEPPRCAFAGCTRPPTFQPCFVVGYDDRKVLLRDMPMRLCAEHRRDLDGIFRRPAVLEALRRKLHRLGRDAPGSVRVLFEVAG